MNIVPVIISIIFLITLLALLRKHIVATPTSPLFERAYGKKTESADTIIERTRWANNYPGRINFPARYLFYSIVLSFLCITVYATDFQINKFFQCIFVVWIGLIAFHNYTQHHSDKHGHYAIERNMKILKNKLGCKRVSISPSKIKFSLTSDCRNFSYTNFSEKAFRWNARSARYSPLHPGE
jgi:hypothetical protein